MNGLWASLVLIGAALGIGAVLAAVAGAAITVVYRVQNGTSLPPVAEGRKVPEVTAGHTVPAQGEQVETETADRGSLPR